MNMKIDDILLGFAQNKQISSEFHNNIDAIRKRDVDAAFLLSQVCAKLQ